MASAKKKEGSVFQKKIVICIIALICTALWGSAFPCIKIGYELFAIDSADTASVILFAGIRFFGAGVLVIIFGSIGKRKFLAPKVSSWGRIFVLSMLQTVIQYLFFYIGLAHTTGVKGSIIQGTGTLFAILFSCLIFRSEAFTGYKLSGCIVGFIGIIMINLTGSGLTMEFALNGEGFLILSSVSYALSSICLARFSAKDSPVMLSGWQFLLGGAIMTAAGLLMGGHLDNFSKEGAFLLLYMMFISAAAYSLWGILLKYNSVSSVTVYGFLTQLFGTAFSALILKETDSINIFTLISLVLVCTGIYLVNRRDKAS